MVQCNIEDAIIQPHDIIAIQVGERRFETSRKTLQPTKWEALEEKLGFKTLGDGTKLYLLDMDGDMFAHILRWLRHAIIPTWVRPTGDPDYGMYSVLRDQADMLGAVGLRDWLLENDLVYPLGEDRYYEPVFQGRTGPGCAWCNGEYLDENDSGFSNHGFSGEETEHERDWFGNSVEQHDQHRGLLGEHSSNETIAVKDNESSNSVAW